MPSLTLSDRLIWFAHCPKAGGTSIERFMVEHWGDAVGHLHWGWDLWWKRGGWRHADPPNSPQHLIWADALPDLPQPPDRIFTVVRDPLARMISEYNFQRRYRRGTWLGRWIAYLPFSTWLGLMMLLKEKNPYSFDNHFRPQSDFSPETARVFRLEEGLEPVMGWLAEVSGTTPMDGAKDRTPMRALAAKSPASITLYAEDITLIHKAFAIDYDRFGYPVPCAGQYPKDPYLKWRAGIIRIGVEILRRLERCGKI